MRAERLAIDDIVEAHALVKKVRGGHIAGLQPQGDAVEPGEAAVNVSFHDLEPGVVIEVVRTRHILS